jgi:hypothetical protein
VGQQHQHLGSAARAVARTVAAAAVTVALGAAGCGGSSPPPDGGQCPNDYSTTCASPAPTFAADAQPVFEARCAPGCHMPGGQEAVIPFQTYDQINNEIGTILFELRDCLMPPPSAPQPTAAERKALLGWIACGALND